MPNIKIVKTKKWKKCYLLFIIFCNNETGDIIYAYLFTPSHFLGSSMSCPPILGQNIPFFQKSVENKYRSTISATGWKLVDLLLLLIYCLCFWKDMTLYSCPDIPDILNIPEIPTIPEISIIIQISLRLWFQKGMSLYVCSNIPEILNIPNIPDIPEIPTIPEIPIIIQITSSMWFRKCMTLCVCLSLMTFPTFPTFLTFRNSNFSWSYCLDLIPCKIWRS